MNLAPPWEIIATMAQGNMTRIFAREAILLIALLLIGLVAVPLAIFWIGGQLLGEFGGTGFADFFGALSVRLLHGDLAAWFFIASPYLAVQSLRLAWQALRGGRRAAS